MAEVWAELNLMSGRTQFVCVILFIDEKTINANSHQFMFVFREFGINFLVVIA